MSLPICHMDPSEANDASAKASEGKLYVWKGDIYRYGQFLDAVTYVAGHSLTYGNATGTAFTNDRSGGSSVGSAPAGVAVRVMTQNYYGYALVDGVYTLTTNADDDIAAGDGLIIDTTNDGDVNSAADPANPLMIGMALAADDDTADTVVAKVRCL